MEKVMQEVTELRICKIEIAVKTEVSYQFSYFILVGSYHRFWYEVKIRVKLKYINFQIFV